jgi:hypothetical protein
MTSWEVDAVLKVLLFVVLLAGVIYLAIRLLQRKGGSGGGRLGRRPVAPDDDPGFLRGLDDQMWEERRRQREGPDDGSPPAPA